MSMRPVSPGSEGRESRMKTEPKTLGVSEHAEKVSKADWQSVHSALRNAGWLPDDVRLSVACSEYVSRSQNLFAVWAESWQARSASVFSPHAGRLRDLLDHDWHLQPIYDRQRESTRWVLMKSPLALQRRIALLSSHLGRDLERRSHWLDRLQLLLSQFSQREASIVSCPGTTADRFLTAVVDDYDWTLTRMEMPPCGQSWLEWLDQAVERLSRSPEAVVQVGRGWVSPEITPAKSHPTNKETGDEILLALGDEVHLLFVRPRGHLQRIIDGRATGQDSLRGLYLDGCDGGVPEHLAEKWVAHGAVRSLPDEPTSTRVVIGGDDPSGESTCVLPSVSALSFRLAYVPEPVTTLLTDSAPYPRRGRPEVCFSGAYLSHWTRSAIGPWPGQSETDYLRQILRHPEERMRSDLDVLLRILSMRRLIASGHLIRCRTPVVCFTAQPLEQFPDRRVYRSHLGRWDFTPYGICFDRDWLESQGARPVIYGDEQKWKDLGAGDRPYFQMASRRRSDGDEAGKIWIEEDEWRVVGDVDFSNCSDNQLYIFVPDQETADCVGGRSPWSIVCLSEIRSRGRFSSGTPTSSADVPTGQ